MFYLMVLLAALKLRAQTVHFALSFIPHVKKKFIHNPVDLRDNSVGLADCSSWHLPQDKKNLVDETLFVF